MEHNHANLDQKVQLIRERLADACGGFSQYNGAMLRGALLGHLSQGMLVGIPWEAVFGAAEAQEAQQFEDWWASNPDLWAKEANALWGR